MTEDQDQHADGTGRMMREIDAGAPRTPDDDISVRTTNIGSFVPEGTYRPVPIVWFVAAMILQFFALAFLLSLPLIGIAIVALCALVSLIVRYWTFGRGMSRASRAWRIATDFALLLNCGWLSALAMLP